MCDFREINEVFSMGVYYEIDYEIEKAEIMPDSMRDLYMIPPLKENTLYSVGCSGVGHYFYFDGSLHEEGNGWEVSKCVEHALHDYTILNLDYSDKGQ